MPICTNTWAQIEGSSWVRAARKGLFQSIVVIKKGGQFVPVVFGDFWCIGIERSCVGQFLGVVPSVVIRCGIPLAWLAIRMMLRSASSRATILA